MQRARKYLKVKLLKDWYNSTNQVLPKKKKVDMDSVRLGQLFQLIHKERSDGRSDYLCMGVMKAIVNSGFDINSATKTTTYAKSHWYSDDDCKKLSYYKGNEALLYYKNSTEYCKGNTALHFAAIRSKYYKIKSLLLGNADITCKNDDGYTPLMLVKDYIRDIEEREFWFESNYNLLLDAHIESKITTNPSCNDGISHFHIACLMNNIPVVDFFLKSGVAINDTVSKTSHLYPGYSALHFAAEYGSDILVEKLLNHGANVNLMNANNLNPLSLMVEKKVEFNDIVFGRELTKDLKSKIQRYDSIIKLLINKSNSTNHVDQNGLSFFHASCNLQDTVLTEKFIETDVDVNSYVNFGSKIFPGYTPLHFAARNNEEMMILLLKKGANLFAKNAYGVTPFDLFVKRFDLDKICKVFNTDTVLKSIRFQDGTKLVDAISAITATKYGFIFKDFILNKKININIQLPFDSPIWPGYSLLHIVITIFDNKKNYDSFYENSKIFEIFEENNIDLSIKDAHGRDPLFLAFLMKKQFYIRSILMYYDKKKIESFSKEKIALYLQIACLTDSRFEEYISYGVDPNVTVDNVKVDKHGSSLYHLVLNNKNLYRLQSFLKILDEANARLDLIDFDGLTCIHIGILNGYSDDWIHDALTKLLSNSNINKIINQPNKYKMSLLHVACWLGNFDAVDTILKITKNHINDQIVCDDSSDRYSKKLVPYLGFTPIHIAIKKLFERRRNSDEVINKFIKIIELLIKNGANVNIKNSKGYDSLHLMLFSLLNSDIFFDEIYHKTPFKMLVREFYKNNNTWQSDFGLTRLHVACYMNDLTSINSLLQSGTENINKQIDLKSPIWPGDTPLHVLLNNTSFEKNTVKLLIDRGADVNIKNLNGQTPFHFMLYEKVFSEEDDYFYILERDNICKLNLCDDNGFSYFHLSCLRDNTIVEKFLKLGVDVNQPVNHLSPTCPGFTPLHFAVQNKNKLLIQQLVKYDADLCAEDSFGRTPLHLAAETDPELLKYLLSDDDKKIIKCENVFGETALDVLINRYFNKAKYSHKIYLGYCKLLLNHDIYVNFFSPLKYSDNLAAFVARSFDSNTMKLLIEKSTNLMKIDSEGQNLIHKIFNATDYNCCSNEVLRVMNNVDLLISKTGLDINFKNEYGRTALHTSLSYRNINDVKMLLNLGADVNISNNKNNTIYDDYDELDEYDSDDENYEEYKRNIWKVLKSHMMKLLYLDFDLNPSIKKIVQSHYMKDYHLEAEEKYEFELKLMENEKLIDTLSWRDVLRNDFVEKFFSSSMTDVDRELILEKLYADSLWFDYEEFCPLLKLQLRKIEKQKKSLELAVETL